MREIGTFMEMLIDGSEPGARKVNHFDFTVPTGTRTAVFDLYNQRLKLYALVPGEYLSCFPNGTADKPEALPSEVTKITVYARPGEHDDEPAKSGWRICGFRKEAVIRRFFADGADAVLWARYQDDRRARDDRSEEHDRIVDIALSKDQIIPQLDSETYACHRGTLENVGEIVDLLQQIFPDYPTPLAPRYISDRLTRRASHYRLIRDADGSLVAATSAEIDHVNRNAEMTDCATLPEVRGRGLMAYLLWRLEQDMVELFDIRDLYTIARADETGMNCVFRKLGYSYDGRLINNCRMPNGWESMNIWCKKGAGRESA